MEEKDIVDRIDELCKKNGTSIKSLERQLGYSNATIRRWRNIKSKPPLEKVTAIAKRLDTTTEYLYTGIEPPVDKIATATELLSRLSEEQIDMFILQLKGLTSGK